MEQRSIYNGVWRGICPFCLGMVSAGLRCEDCGNDCTAWQGDVLPTSWLGERRLTQMKAVRNARCFGALKE